MILLFYCNVLFMNYIISKRLLLSKKSSVYLHSHRNRSTLKDASQIQNYFRHFSVYTIFCVNCLVTGANPFYEAIANEDVLFIAVCIFIVTEMKVKTV